MLFRSVVQPVICLEPKKVEPEPDPEPTPPPFFENITEMPSQKIMREVSEKHKIPVDHIKGDSRRKHIINARHEFCYRLKNELGFSLKQIGRMIGNRDHTTVLNAIRKHEKNLAKGYPEASEYVSDESEEEASSLS